ncbi:MULTISPECIES: PfkB family carbohydrate kinase [unclassified Caballeronia]|uniref:PfkB family carbohydrate kinase n=1 Tax=unclassified Caballeronia TaxID=2646786 RepID=UPI002859537C|nr:MULTISPECIES: PfkB family carbohydrate kinase [unclassified Caballeronia]MDR5763071.1 PfkB family carbohydrate kinase [Caballeronia sp. LZ035]MDR5884197.1 PfkB family carbohydrate kinase [Caballeronia sp. LZ032]
MLDLAPPQHAGDAAVRRCWPQVHACSPNEEEASALTGIDIGGKDDALSAARKLHESGFELACVKLGDGGCVAFSNEGPRSVSVGPINPVDTTGAGDAFSGALAVALAESRPRDDALRFATAAANLAVMRSGSQESYASRDETDRWAAALGIEAPNA